MEKKKSLEMKKNRIIGIVFLFFSLFLIFGLLELKPSSRVMPMLLSFCIALIGIMLFVQAQLKLMSDDTNKLNSAVGESQNEDEDSDTMPFSDYVYVFIMLLVTFFLIPIIGFYVTVMLFSTSIYLFYEKKWNLRELKNSILFGIVLIVFLYLIFNSFMGLHTPSGLLM